MPGSLPDRSALLGTGHTADVYAWGEGRVLKLFHPGRPWASVQREFTVTRVIHETGLPAPAAVDLIELDGRPGIIYERIDGPTLVDQSQARPWRMFAVARQFAELHAELHSRPAPAGLPSQIGWLDSALSSSNHISAEAKQHARRQLAQLPQGTALCHGDFHPGNILCSRRGPIVIDWDAATIGHPLGDVAWTSHLFSHAPLPPATPRPFILLFESLRAWLHETYLNRYFQLCPGTRDDLAAWNSLVEIAATVLRRGVHRSE